MTARELINILQKHKLTLVVVDCFNNGITDVLFKAEYIRLSNDETGAEVLTVKELIDLLQCDEGLWLDVPIVDAFTDEITNVIITKGYIRLSDDSE